MEIALIESPDIKEKRLGMILRISKSKVDILSPTLSPPRKKNVVKTAQEHVQEYNIYIYV